jgi:hypothetical protein
LGANVIAPIAASKVTSDILILERMVMSRC